MVFEIEKLPKPRDFYVIHQSGGLYWEMLCPMSRDKGHSFPNTD